jgi:putative FmdB family regulatory protein
MPIYEYKCQKCGDVFDVKQKFSDEALTMHEACGGAVERLISAPALRFKGTGWYVTDYARKKDNGGSSTSGDKPKGDSTKSETKSSDTSSTASSTPAKTDSK